MKIAMGFFLLLAMPATAQSDRLKTMLEQIVALQVYIGHVEKGYKIVKQGLHLVEKIKKGDLDLHEEWLSRRRTVNPRIARWAVVHAIGALQARMRREIPQTLSAIRRFGQLTDTEWNYCARVLGTLRQSCTAHAEELRQVLAADQREMNDAERLRRIDKLYREQWLDYERSRQFSQEMALLSVHRLREEIDIKISKQLR